MGNSAKEGQLLLHSRLSEVKNQFAMAFVKPNTSKVEIESPQSLFRDLKSRSIPGLLDHQSELLTRYVEEAIAKKDVAFELPTGSGKTLIGLLIAEYRRKKFGEKVLYLCPTKQLVNQVVAYSRSRYGIQTCGFTGSKEKYDPRLVADYKTNKAIGVTNYSSLFNVRPFFDDPDVIILDDAHAAENYLISVWSLSITKKDHQDLFRAIADTLKPEVELKTYFRLTKESSDAIDSEWVELVPFPKQYILSDAISSIIETYVEDTDDPSLKSLKFGWSKIRDRFWGVGIYLSHKEILFRPYLPPTEIHLPFANAKQRIYLSATLGKSGELERLVGRKGIHRISAPKGWERQGLGRRFFLFPDVMANEVQTSSFVKELSKRTPRTLMLVPSDAEAEKLKAYFTKELPEHTIFDNDSFSETGDAFLESPKGIAILANRFEGLDMANNQCRSLVITGLPKSTHLQERFLTTKMAANILFKERIRTRIVQALGRTTRGLNDFSSVCVFGNDLVDALVNPSILKGFHPELQAELWFGHEQSRSAENLNGLMENFDLFINQGDDWRDANESILEYRDKVVVEVVPDFEQLGKAADHEVAFVHKLWSKDLVDALKEADMVISLLNGNSLKGYKGFWYYMAGNVAFQLWKEGKAEYENKAMVYYESAANCTNAVTWLRDLALFGRKMDLKGSETAHPLLVKLIDGIETQLAKYGKAIGNKFEEKLKRILEGLRENRGTSFEVSQKELGEFLGFRSMNYDETASPDPIWMLENDFCIVFEDKIFDKDKEIPINDLKQAKGHYDWIKSRFPELKEGATILVVMLSNSTQLSKEAEPFCSDLYYWNLKDFQAFAEECASLFRSLRTSFVEAGNIEWREAAIKEVATSRLSPQNLLNLIKSSPLSKLLPSVES